MRANTEWIADDGTTPTRLAVMRNDAPTVELLIQAGANLNAVGVDDVPLIVLACECDASVARLLIQAAADPNQTDGDGRSALDVAVRRGEFALCEELLSRGAKPSRRQDTASGNTVLHVAVMHRHEPLVRSLVRHKADLSIQNHEGCTPLLLASAIGQEAVVELLVQAGSAMHIVDEHNRSALELALQAGHLAALKVRGATLSVFHRSPFVLRIDPTLALRVRYFSSSHASMSMGSQSVARRSCTSPQR